MITKRENRVQETDFASTLVQEYLIGKEIGVLATVNPDGSPLAMPMWFVHDRDVIGMVSEAQHLKVKNLHNDARVGFVVESGSGGSIECIIIQGEATFVSSAEDRTRVGEQFIAKYGTHMEQRWGGRAVPDSRALFLIQPRRIKLWGTLAS